ncbi:ubiquitin-like modifier-activating enzyme 7 isoform X3 [Apteryx mantelli]|uniref:Ubiquitin-like modifier-activating enzyme 7 isoform X3 n=1 Tax=Apteryx mantelli TaxID=2696672 RepID=A0ABM4F378_9AVES
MAGAEPGAADEGLYSRQLYVLGRGAMERLAGATVLVVGLRGLGAEVAKALVLAGARSVTLHDVAAAGPADRASQFFLTDSDMGQNRAVASQRHLAELNSHVLVTAHTGELSESFLASFQTQPLAQVVVLTDSPLEEQLRIGDFCHGRSICFIVADVKGLAGQLFCDFGDHFVVHDPTDTNPVCASVQHISQGNPGIVTYASGEEGRGHLFCDGDMVTFSGVEGMTELNGREPCPVHVLDAFHLEIGDTSSFSPYRCGGLVWQVHLPQEHSYEPLRKALVKPKIQVTNPEDLPRSRSLHMAFQALHAFRKEQGRLPLPRAQGDAERVLELARSLDEQQGPLDEDVVRAFASVSMGDLGPMAAFIGGLAAQEVLKAASGKFLPLDQWLYFDALECLALEGAAQLTEEDCAPRGSRYDGQIAVFGADFQERLGHQKYFVVGAGAIGCELLKNFAMMGLAAGTGGDITVTDMDTIARSNLHRQFLFRSADISKPKSEVAAAAVRCMNPDITVMAHQNQVGPATELVYGADFFKQLDGVASALDNLETRAYLESRCLRYLKPLVDSGMEGTQGNVLAMVPHLTKALGPASDPVDKTFPLCTLRHFPRTIEHTLQWARDEFEGLFRLPAENVNRFLADPTFLEHLEAPKALEVLEQVWRSLRERPRDWQDCVHWARQHWQSCYHNSISQLLLTFPPEHEISPGVTFWSGDRRCPHPLTFDPDNDTHMAYVMAAAHLFAQTHKVLAYGDRATAQESLRNLVLPPFTPQEGLQIHITEERQEVQETVDQRRLAELSQELARWRRELVEAEEMQIPVMEPIHFEKDNNFHVDFVTAASNLRAENYGIPCADWLTSKRIVGRIVPAIVTTTMAVAGLACLEIYKLVWGCKDRSCYRNSNLCLSDSLLFRMQPLPPPTYRYGQKEWSCWDRLEVQGIGADGQEMTVQELLDWLQRVHGLAVAMLLHGYTVLYDREQDEETRAQQQAQRLSESLEGAGEPRPRELELQYVCEGEEDQDEDTCPPLLCYLP